MSHLLAYLDPGTGSMLLQLAAGGLFGSLYFVKRSWRHFKGMLTKRGAIHHDA